MTEYYIAEAGLTEDVREAAAQAVYGPRAIPPDTPAVEKVDAVDEHLPKRSAGPGQRMERPQLSIDEKMARLEGMVRSLTQHTLNGTTRPPCKRDPKRLPPAWGKAFAALQWAIRKEPELAEATDFVVFNWLVKRADCPHRLPKLFPTFIRYTTGARRFKGCPKRKAAL
jgi:hypothetical protein